MRFLHTQLKNRFLHFKIYFSFPEKYNIKKKKTRLLEEKKIIHSKLDAPPSQVGHLGERALFLYLPFLGSQASSSQAPVSFMKRSPLVNNVFHEHYGSTGNSCFSKGGRRQQKLMGKLVSEVDGGDLTRAQCPESFQG